jgi:uncharacterized protein YneF (UPF0154 family)
VSTGWIVLIVVLVILIGVLVGLYFFGKKAEKKQAAQQEQMDAMAQTVNMLIIDKKKMKLKEANLPSAVLENTPKFETYQSTCCKSKSRTKSDDFDV